MSELLINNGIIEAEQSVLGSMLIEPRCIPAVVTALNEEDFCLEVNRDIFSTMCGMHTEGARIDPVTVLEEQRKQGTYREKQSRAYILQLMEITPTAANVMEYTEILRRDTLRRRLQEITEQASTLLKEKAPPEEVCSLLQGEIERVSERESSSSLVTGSKAMLDYLTYREKLASGMKAYVAMGFKSLDKTLGGGLVREGLYILAARPGVGKTTLGLQVAEKVAQRGTPVLFVSLEMSIEQLSAKRLAVKTGLPSNQILLGDLSEVEHEKVCMAAHDLSNVPLFFNSRPGASVTEIALLARQVRGCGLLVVDYLGLIRHKKGASLYERVTLTSNALKRLARSLGVPILCLAQLSRANEQRADKKPQLSDLRDSGAIEQDADGVLLLHRIPKDENSGPFSPDFLDCIIAKNRHGETGSVSLSMYPKSGRIVAAQRWGA